MGKTFKAKTPPGEFKVTTLENPLLSITSGYKYKESYQTLWPIPEYQHYKKNDLLRRTYCGGCETGRYMSPIAAGFGPAAEHGSIAAG